MLTYSDFTLITDFRLILHLNLLPSLFLISFPDFYYPSVSNKLKQSEISVYLMLPA